METLTTLYGAIGNIDAQKYIGHYNRKRYRKILDKLFTKNSEIVDLDSLMQLYIESWLWWIKTPKFRGGIIDFATVAENLLDEKGSLIYAPKRYLSSLENIGRNLIISPHVIKKLDIANKWKKHFPFYTEIEFTAKLLTNIGDSIKQLFLTRFLSYGIASTVTDIRHYDYSGLQNNSPIKFVPGDEYEEPQAFIEYTEEKIYDTIGLEDIASVTAPGEPSPSAIKTTIPLMKMIDGWIDKEHNVDQPSYDDYPHSSIDSDFREEEIRNYVSFLRNNEDEFLDFEGGPGSENSNIVWKTLFGSAFKAKLLSIYKENRRSFMDIVNGKPAYSEDIFYRIEKQRKNQGSDQFVTVQNTFIPNTSDLDIVRFIDTQMKYHNYATYRYNVYAERVVFGSKYSYQWPIYQSDGTISIASQPGATYENSFAGIPETTYSHFGTGLAKDQNPVGASSDYSADFKVIISPSIKIVEDKIFSTPEILIMDRPPVAPDVNIVPYRAVNNRIKIILSGQADRYREIPVEIVASDTTAFEKVKAAQLSYDGKVEFGSDDPVSNFQIFKSEVKTKTYKDFSPYQMNAGPVL